MLILVAHLPPQPGPVFPRLALQASEFFHVAKWIFRIGMGISAPDQLGGIKERTVFEIEIAESASVPVLPLLVIFKADKATFKHSAGECGCFLAEFLHRLPRVNRFRGIDTYEPDGDDSGQHNGVAVNYPGDEVGLGSRSTEQWRENE